MRTILTILRWIIFGTFAGLATAGLALALMASYNASAAPKKYTSTTCVRIVNADGTGFLGRDLETGGIVYDHDQRTLTLLPCTLFADGMEGR